MKWICFFFQTNILKNRIIHCIYKVWKFRLKKNPNVSLIASGITCLSLGQMKSLQYNSFCGTGAGDIKTVVSSPCFPLSVHIDRFEHSWARFYVTFRIFIFSSAVNVITFLNVWNRALLLLICIEKMPPLPHTRLKKTYPAPLKMF